MQHAVLHGVMLRRTGIATSAFVRYGPGSAAHQAAEERPAAVRPGHAKFFRSSTLNLAEHLSPSPKPRLSCPCPVHEGALLEAILKVGQSESWPRRGNPDRSMRRPRPCLASMDSGGPWVPVR